MRPGKSEFQTPKPSVEVRATQRWGYVYSKRLLSSSSLTGRPGFIRQAFTPWHATAFSLHLSPFYLLSAPGEARPSQAPREFSLLPRAPETGKMERETRARTEGRQGRAGQATPCCRRHPGQTCLWPSFTEVWPKASATRGACPPEGLGEETPFMLCPSSLLSHPSASAARMGTCPFNRPGPCHPTAAAAPCD